MPAIRKADFLQLFDDNISNIIEKLDLLSAINLIVCSKHIYNKRIMFVSNISEVQKYKNYKSHEGSDNIIAVLFNSYINLRENVDINELKNKIHISYQKAYNTINLVAFYCQQNQLIFHKYKTNTCIVELLAKAVCKECKYKYTRPADTLYSLFWIEWYDINIHLLDICKIIYHVKHRKYRNLMNTLAEIKFNSDKEKDLKTIDFFTRYVGIRHNTNKTLNTAIIYILYKLIDEHFDNIKEAKILCNVVVEKAHEFIDVITHDLHGVPKYFKEFVITKFRKVADMINAQM